MQQTPPPELPVPTTDAPPPPPPVPQEMVEEAPRRGCSGCAWGIAGGFGCLSLVALPFVIAIILGTTTLGSIFSNISGIFNPPPPTLIFSSTFVLDKIQGLSQLTTTRYNFSGLVTTQTEMPALLNALYGQQLVMMAVGHINAGVDMSQLTEADVVYNDGILTINLPVAAIQDCFLNEQQTRVIERSGGAFSGSTGQTLDAESRVYAVRQFRDQALENGILEEAQGQAAIAIEELIGILGIEKVRTVTIVPKLIDPAAPALPLPDSCL